MFSLICNWTNSWVNYGDAGDLRRLRAYMYYDVIVIVNQSAGLELQVLTLDPGAMFLHYSDFYCKT